MGASQKTPAFKSGFAAIVGRPNVGKSTLMNALLEQKLAIVSPRPQTTRNQILGILNSPGYQVILMDTPGMMQPKYLLQKKMLQIANQAASQADVILFLTEAGRLKETDEQLLKVLEKFRAPKYLILNKIDLISKNNMLPVIDRYQKTGIFKEILPISALKKDGLDLLLPVILKEIPAGEPFYPPDIISSEPERFFVSEIIREHIFMKYSDEIPYATNVQVEQFNEKERGKTYIEAVSTVERDSQKRILIGKGGAALKEVGTKSRKQIERFLDQPVFLDLVVRVRKKWRRDPSALRHMGF